MPALDREPRPWPSSPSNSGYRSRRPPKFSPPKRIQQQLVVAETPDKVHPEAIPLPSSPVGSPPGAALAPQTLKVPTLQDGSGPKPSYHVTKRIYQTSESVSSQRTRPGASSTLVVKASKLGSAKQSRQARHNEDNRLVEEAKRQAAALTHRAHQVSDLNQNKETVRDIRHKETSKAATSKASLPSKTSVIAKKSSSYTGRGRTFERENSRRRSLVATDSPKPHVGGKRPAPVAVKAGIAAPVMKPLNAHVQVRTRGPITRTSEKQIASKTKMTSLAKQRPGSSLKESQRKPAWRGNQSKYMNKSEEGKKAIIESTMGYRSSAPSPEETAFIAHGQKSGSEPKSTTRKEPSFHDPKASRTSFYSPVSSPDLFKSSDTTIESATKAELPHFLIRDHSSSWVAPVYRPKTRRDRDNYKPPTRPRPIRPSPTNEYKDLEDAPILLDIMQLSKRSSKLPPAVPKNTPENSIIDEDTREASDVLLSITNISIDPADGSRPNSPNHGHGHPFFSREHSSPAPYTINSGSGLGCYEGSRKSACNGLFSSNSTPKLSPRSLHAEDMSSIEMDEVLRLDSPPLEVARAKLDEWRRRKFSDHGFFSNSVQDIGGPLELKFGNGALDLSVNTEVQARRDAQKQSLLDFHAESGSSQILLHSILDSDKISYGNQLKIASSASSPSSKIPIPKEKFRRGGIKDVQWLYTLPIRLKEDITPEVESNHSSRTSSSMVIEISEPQSTTAQQTSELAKYQSDPMSYVGFQSQPKALASCLSNSRRGRGLHVSFASSAEDDIPTNVKITEQESANDELSARISSAESAYIQDRNNKGREMLDSSMNIINPELGARTVAETANKLCPGRYWKKGYKKEAATLHNIFLPSNLLLQKISLLPSEGSDEQHRWDNAGPSFQEQYANFLGDLKERCLSRPEVYDKLRVLMGTSPKKELMEPKQTEHVDAEVAKLLAFAPDLLELYKKFRPLMNNVSSSGEKLFTNAKDTNTEQRETSVRASRGDDSPRIELYNEKRKVPKNDEEMANEIFDMVKDTFKGLRYGLSHTRGRSTTVPRTKKDQAKYNPAAAEFRPLLDRFNPPLTIPSWQAFPEIQAGEHSSLDEDCQIRNAGVHNAHGPIFALEEARGVIDAKGYHTMPNRTRSKYLEAPKKYILAREMPEPLPLKAPLTMNGTTYYTLPKPTILPSGIPLLGMPSMGEEEECKIVFSNPIPDAPFKCLPRQSHSGRNYGAAPLWMRTPLVPLRKISGIKPTVPQTDAAASKNSIDEHGIEVERLEDEVAKMKLDDFISRFPMTGRKSQVVSNMKQKYAAEIQHRLELVLWEKKEKEAAARKLQIQNLVAGKH